MLLERGWRELSKSTWASAKHIKLMIFDMAVTPSGGHSPVNLDCNGTSTTLARYSKTPAAFL